MGTGLSQVNFLWLCKRFSRSPLALWYSLRSTSSALGSGRPLPPPFSQTNFQSQSFIEFVILAACGFSCTHWRADKLSLQAVSTTVYYLIYILQPHVLPSFTACGPTSSPTSPTLLSLSSSQKGSSFDSHIESRTSPYSPESMAILLREIFHLWWALCCDTSTGYHPFSSRS